MPRRSLALALLLTFFIAPGEAQLRVAPIGERPDSVTLELLLRKLASTGTFMQTDALGNPSAPISFRGADYPVAGKSGYDQRLIQLGFKYIF